MYFESRICIATKQNSILVLDMSVIQLRHFKRHLQGKKLEVAEFSKQFGETFPILKEVVSCRGREKPIASNGSDTTKGQVD